MRSRSCVLTIVALCTGAASRAARAGTLVVTNLNEKVAFADPIVPNDPAIGQFGFEPGQQFNTGPTATSLDRIFVNIGDYTAGTGGFQLAATLQADSGGVPGAVLDTFTFNVATIPTSGFANVEFNPVSPFTLAANTNYWFVLAGRLERRDGKRELELDQLHGERRPRQHWFVHQQLRRRRDLERPVQRLAVPHRGQRSGAGRLGHGRHGLCRHPRSFSLVSSAPSRHWSGLVTTRTSGLSVPTTPLPPAGCHQSPVNETSRPSISASRLAITAIRAIPWVVRRRIPHKARFG